MASRGVRALAAQRAEAGALRAALRTGKQDKRRQADILAHEPMRRVSAGRKNKRRRGCKGRPIIAPAI
eukprot:1707355-Alexandrium_andersonii.AAC.1